MVLSDKNNMLGNMLIHFNTLWTFSSCRNSEHGSRACSNHVAAKWNRDSSGLSTLMICKKSLTWQMQHLNFIYDSGRWTQNIQKVPKDAGCSTKVFDLVVFFTGRCHKAAFIPTPSIFPISVSPLKEQNKASNGYPTTPCGNNVGNMWPEQVEKT